MSPRRADRGQRSRGRRQGNVFALRLAPGDRVQLEALCAADRGPKGLGPWLVWKALGGSTGVNGLEQVVPELGAGEVVPGLSAGVGTTAPGKVIPSRGDCGKALTKGVCCMPAGHDGPHMNMWVSVPADPPPIGERLILDLCAGSGSWSEPYREAGYLVQRVTLPQTDVRTFNPKARVWGVLAAPPCTEFSLAKNGQDRDFVKGLETVAACLRIIMTAQPRWWALENPVGLLGRWLGRPRAVFDPHDFGDPWSKRTALWGSFNPPKPGPFTVPVDGGGPLCTVCHPDDPRTCSIADHRAVTPPGFARAFFEANQ